MAKTEELLTQAYQKWCEKQNREGSLAQMRIEVPKKRQPYKNRPRCISYDDGTQIRIERDSKSLAQGTPDIILFETAKGTFVLNEMTDEPVLFYDTGDYFTFYESYQRNKPRTKEVLYGSDLLKKFKGNIYILLHELGHYQSDKRELDKPAEEVHAWKEADKFVEVMGLTLFDNDEERQLFRDISLRTYDPFNGYKIVQNELMKQIDAKKFDMNLLYGLVHISERGKSLVRLCKKLISEHMKSPSPKHNILKTS
jgi:phenylpropionate dioxygenase-like ring-hydroxylating dioxygenase large terminal subunit